jgi:hypothetical protein
MDLFVRALKNPPLELYQPFVIIVVNLGKITLSKWNEFHVSNNEDIDYARKDKKRRLLRPPFLAAAAGLDPAQRAHDAVPHSELTPTAN